MVVKSITFKKVFCGLDLILVYSKEEEDGNMPAMKPLRNGTFIKWALLLSIAFYKMS